MEGLDPQRSLKEPVWRARWFLPRRMLGQSPVPKLGLGLEAEAADTNVPFAGTCAILEGPGLERLR